MAIIQVQGREIECQAILFDKDGTILHFMGLWGSWAEMLIRLVRQELTALGFAEALQAAILPGVQMDETGRVVAYDKKGPLAMGTEEEVTALLAASLYAAGLPWNEAIMAVRRLNALAMAELRERREARPLPGLYEFVQMCRAAGLKLAVVTSDGTAEAIEHLTWMGIQDEFGSIVGRDRVKRGKPEPDMALLACQELGVEPGEAIVIGDSNADMQMGRYAGVRLTIGLAEVNEELDTAISYLRDADVLIQGYAELAIE
ncbi:HAD family hydrolase [Paenibacillus sanguinis]|uniref:HAD family hydrolase n=1 Tax=Paenibacillus sanguinis TaxID=225906 RepID=UPI00035F6AB7|nr:HAD family hydrolase [Paenibacillus sanguinis]